MSSRLYKEVFYKYWNVNYHKFLLDNCEECARRGLITFNEYKREHERVYPREFNSFKRRFIKHFPQVKLKELK